ncbi:signal peptidase I [Viscerimonas tarda]
MKERAKHVVKNILQWSLIIIVSLMVALSFRIFIFSTFKIPSKSMEPTIIPGDHILVNKLVPGPRILKNLDLLEKTGYLDIWRPNLFSIERNDVLVFNFPWNKTIENLNIYYVKRCVAIPGDTFYIENGINKVMNLITVLGNSAIQNELSTTDDNKFVPGLYRCFPHDSIYGWNIKNFGPIYIPKAFDMLHIDGLNIKLYKNIIEYETNKKIRVKNNEILLNDSLIWEYKLLQNYYFMAGDNVFDSKDSRYWGLLPEDHIVGKVAFIWKSEDTETGEIRWNRILKLIE